MSIPLSPVLFRSKPGVYMHWCPGCNERHLVWTYHEGGRTGPTWDWNGLTDKPTFSPSLKHTWGKVVCHYWIRDGELIFCEDSTHSLAGKTVPLPPIPIHDETDSTTE